MSILNVFPPTHFNSRVTLCYLGWLSLFAGPTQSDLHLWSANGSISPTPTLPAGPELVDTTRLAIVFPAACLILTLASGLVLCGARFVLPQPKQRLSLFALLYCLGCGFILVTTLNLVQIVYNYADVHRLLEIFPPDSPHKDPECEGTRTELLTALTHASADDLTSITESIPALESALAPESTSGSIDESTSATEPNPAVEFSSVAELALVSESSSVAEHTPAAELIPVAEPTPEPIFVREESDVFFEVDPEDETFFQSILNGIVVQVGCESASFNGIAQSVLRGREPILVFYVTLRNGCRAALLTLVTLPAHEGLGDGIIHLRHGKKVAFHIVKHQVIETPTPQTPATPEPSTPEPPLETPPMTPDTESNFLDFGDDVSDVADDADMDIPFTFDKPTLNANVDYAINNLLVQVGLEPQTSSPSIHEVLSSLCN